MDAPDHKAVSLEHQQKVTPVEIDAVAVPGTWQVASTAVGSFLGEGNTGLPSGLSQKFTA